MLRIKRNLIASGSKRIWSALYQQNPAPDEGLTFRKEMFRYYTHAPARKGRRIAQAWDFAITEATQNDYTVGTTLMQDEFDNLFVLDVNRFRSGDGEFIVDEILNYAQTWNADILGFEDGQIWKSIFSTFERRCQERRQFPTYEILQPLTDKLVRAGPLKGRMQIGKVHFNKTAAWYNDLEHEMLRFPASKHDDQVDSLSWCVRTLLTLSAPRIEEKTPNRQDSWMKRLFAKGSRDLSHMSS
jgi:predicted phage terminase large subunit-like protein